MKGAHTIPEKSAQLPGVNIRILSVDGTSPGNNPTVAFTLTDNKGNALDASKMDDLTLALGGPTTDYSFSAREDATKAVPGISAYTYKFNAAIPAGGAGTFVVGAEAYRDMVLQKVDGTNVTGRDAAATKVFYFGVTDGNPVKRRIVVAIERCNVCHDKLSAHDQSRNNLEYCPICHRPNMTDEAGRPKDKMPAESLDLKNLIHKLHSGDQLAKEYTLYDNGSPKSLNSARFPGDRRNCSKCHEGKSFQLPLQNNLMVTVTPRGFFSPTPPIAAACLACHDDQSAAAHAFVNIAPFGEDCATCHGEDAQFAVTRVHAR